MAEFVKSIFMTAPESFAVKYSINVHMNGKIGTVDKVKAITQWNNLKTALEEAGADVTVSALPPENMPDAVFMANAGINFNNLFFPSYFKCPERQVEEEYFTSWFKDKDFDIFVEDVNTDLHDYSFEGAGDCLADQERQLLWMGYGFRSTLSAQEVIEDFLLEADRSEYMVRPVKLIDPRWYHLDTCFCPLDNGMLLWYPPALDDTSRHLVELIYDDKAIPVSLQDATKFACNAVSVGSKLILPPISKELVHKLESRGIEPVQVDLSEYKKSGGSAKCLTLEILQ